MSKAPRVTWQIHDQHDGWWKTTCGIFEARLDQDLGHLTLHRMDAPAIILTEGDCIHDLTPRVELEMARMPCNE